ncbi:23S rRNA (pseudouridine(1915)-N(3))-methyltransferase RlmH [Aminobacterium colombiense]|uniref:23S rRNA (pseudouridine(1915)-N(3))-methyltransferase RlmH n=1 Tax=Aminobacterium colombiense TaxID=81468 RepID=UPI00332D02E7
MKIVIITVGQPRNQNIAELINEYSKRCRPFMPLEFEHVPEARGASAPEKAIEQESDGLLKRIKNRDYLVLLDEKGEQFTSVAFSQWVYRSIGEVRGRLVFVIGGSHGVAERVKKRSQVKIALSILTFPHELCLLFLTEQLYRAIAIHEGMSYHH